MFIFQVEIEMTGENMDGNMMEPPHIYVERTLAIIKPDAVHKAEEIQDIILRSGFAILQVIYYFWFPIPEFNLVIVKS